MKERIIDLLTQIMTINEIGQKEWFVAFNGDIIYDSNRPRPFSFNKVNQLL